MVTLTIDETLNAQLELVSNRKGQAKAEVVAEVLRHYVQSEQSKLQLQYPALIALYKELADEDVALAEEGMDEYSRQLEDDNNAATLVVVQKQRPGQFFTADQQQRREELMTLWREVRDANSDLSTEMQS